MGFFARAIISGFGFSLGKAIFDKVKDHIGLGDTPSASQNGIPEMANDIEDVEPERDPTHGPAMDLESLERVAN